MTNPTLPEPTCPELIRLRTELSPASWAKRYAEACEQAAIVARLVERCGDRKPGRSEIRDVAPGVDRTNAMRWWTRVQEGEGTAWERLFDRRVVEPPWVTPPEWVQAVQVLGSQDPPPPLESIRATLQRRFGEEAGLGDTKLRAILAGAGLSLPGRAAPPAERVVRLHGGGGLVLLLAAARETGAFRELATTVGEQARKQTAPAGEVPAEPAGRDAEGHFTAEYNRRRLELLEERELPLYRSVDESRAEKDLTRLRLRTQQGLTLANHLLCLTALPLLTEQRGTGGLNNPSGAWLTALNSPACGAKTLEKTLQELKWLGVSEALWSTHARTWLPWSRKWGEGSWREAVLYVDATNDPWWTQRFATCGKVSRTGQVQPSLQRVVMSAGPGVPVLGVVASGRCNLGDVVQRLVGQVEEVAGPASVRRVTVVDAECCQLELLRGFAQHPERQIITVLKGALAQGKALENPGGWRPFRQRDQLREGTVTLGTGESALQLRAVELARPGSRRRRGTIFLTTVPATTWTAEEVAEAYLGRWPYQEDLFRRGRDGAGLERSHGFGARAVTHVALVDKQEKAARRLKRAALARDRAADVHDRAVLNLAAAQDRLAERRAAEPALDGRSAFGVRLGERRLDEAIRALKEADRAQQEARDEYQALRDTPAEIYVRDTEMDSVATCFKMSLLAQLEYISREYLDGYRITPRKFVESWVGLPVTIRKSRGKLSYEVTRNTRDRVMTEIFQRALKKITDLNLIVDGRRLVAQLVDR